MGREKQTPEARAFLKRLGAAIREGRKGYGLHQEQLGARCGISGPRVGEIERGNTNPSIVRVAQLARGLGVSPSDLLRLSESTAAEMDASAKRRVRIAIAMQRLQPRHLAALWHFVEVMAGEQEPG